MDESDINFCRFGAYSFDDELRDHIRDLSLCLPSPQSVLRADLHMLDTAALEAEFSRINKMVKRWFMRNVDSPRDASLTSLNQQSEQDDDRSTRDEDGSVLPMVIQSQTTQSAIRSAEARHHYHPFYGDGRAEGYGA